MNRWQAERHVTRYREPGMSWLVIGAVLAAVGSAIWCAVIGWSP